MCALGEKLSVLLNSNFRKLFIAAFASQLGTVAGMTAFTFFLLDRFGKQPYYATLTEMVYSLPTLTVFFLVGVVADRIDRQRIAVYSDWIRFGLTLVFLLAVSTESMAFIFTVLFVRSAIGKFFDPAQSAILQGILKDDEYTVAAGLNQMLISTFVIFGSGIGAMCYWTLGVRGAIIVDAISFAFSAFLIQTCRIDGVVRMPNGPLRLRDLKMKSVFQDFQRGMSYIIRHRLLLTLMSGFLILGVVTGGFSVMPVFMMKYKLSPGHYQQVTAVLGIVAGAGMLVGSVAVPLLTKTMKPHQTMCIGFLVGGILISAEAFAPNVWIYMILDFLFSVSVPFVNIAYGGFLPRIVEPGMMGRVQGWISPLSTSMYTVTLLIIAYVFPRYVTIDILYYVVGGCILLISVYYGVTLGSMYRNYERAKTMGHDPVTEPA